MQNSITRRASLSTAPSTWNAEARTIDVTFSTFADVQRHGYIERVTRDGLDLSRLVGAHVLKDHNASSIDNVLGVVVSARPDGTATLRLSDRPEVAAIVGDIAKGVIRHLSFSANVSQWRESTDPKSGARIKTAVRWTPHELSFVAVPADPGATTRSITMPELDNAPENPANETATRNQAIRSLCRTNGMTTEFTDSQIDGDGDLIAVRAAVNDELQRRAPVIRATIGVDHTDPAKIVERRANALYARGAGIQPDEASKEHYHDSIPDVARWALQASGQPHRGNDADLVSRAMHTTGDFPLILENVANKSLEAAYPVNRSPIVTKLGRQKTLSTFHPASILRVGEIAPLEDLSESGEFKHTTRTEEKNTLALETGGRRIDYSGKLLVQDDAGALVDAPTQFALAATAWENSKVLGLFAANPVLGDGKQWFDATRTPSNYDASNTPITIESVSQAKLAMRKTTGLDGTTILDIAPAYLLVSAELEDVAIQFMSQYNAQFWAETNPHKLEILVDPRLPAFEWYIFASPSRAPTLDVATLAGQSAPRVTSRESWDTWGISFRCLHHFGCAAVSARGAYKFANGQDSNSEI
jgi:hypothetical protein